MQDVRLIVSDIEGCLSAGKGQRLDLAALTQIQNWNEGAQNGEHPPLTLCTGRSQPFVEAFCQALAVFVPAICENGAYLYDPLKDQTRQHPDVPANYTHATRNLLQQLEVEVAPIISFRVEPGKEICASINPDSDDEPATEQRVIDLYELTRPLADPALFNVTHSASAVDITPAGIDKGAGLQFLSEETGIPVAQMLGIGDTEGDRPFLELAGRSAAPQNGRLALESTVDYVAEQPGPQGVLEIIASMAGSLRGVAE